MINGDYNVLHSRNPVSGYFMKICSPWYSVINTCVNSTHNCRSGKKQSHGMINGDYSVQAPLYISLFLQSTKHSTLILFFWYSPVKTQFPYVEHYCEIGYMSDSTR